MERIFFNSTQKNMSLEDVEINILDFINKTPRGDFKIMVGTDSQLIGQQTCFATGVVIHRVGHGAWCCINKHIEPRRITSLREKIHMETVSTYEVICTLNDLITLKTSEILLGSKDSTFKIEAHIDVGRNGATRTLIREMLGYFEGIGIPTQIKPYSFVASSYANRFSKTTKSLDKLATFIEPSYVYAPFMPKTS
jgi:hypothetical protein